MEDERAPDPDDDRELTRLPPHWRKISKELLLARVARIGNPNAPLAKIGRFDGLGTLGEGGCGVVFEVIDPDLDRHVALKLCHTRGPKAAEAIAHEAQLVAKLSHPNVITVHETGKIGDDAYFVMELVKGANGKVFSGRDLVYARPSWRDAVNIYRAAGRGLAAAHAHVPAIVHGDFKPSNVLIDAAGRPRVADFGLAQLCVAQEPGIGRVVLRHQPGTTQYMAPEVLAGNPGGPLADQWSFCVSLWETIEDELPFAGSTDEALLEAIEQTEPFEGEPVGDPPAQLREVLRRGLAVDPADRWPDMPALLDALDELIAREDAAKLHVRDLLHRRPSGGLLVYMAMGAAFCVMLGALASALLLRTPAQPDASETQPGPTTPPDSEAEQISKALDKTLDLIETRKYAEANSHWKNQEGKFRSVSLIAAGNLEVGLAFLERAAVEKKHGAVENAREAGNFARERALAAMADEDESGTPACELRDDTLEFLASLEAAPQEP